MNHQGFSEVPIECCLLTGWLTGIVLRTCIQENSVKRKSSDQHFYTNVWFNSDANNNGDTKFISILMSIKIDWLKVFDFHVTSSEEEALYVRSSQNSVCTGAKQIHRINPQRTGNNSHSRTHCRCLQIGASRVSAGPCGKKDSVHFLHSSLVFIPRRSW